MDDPETPKPPQLALHRIPNGLVIILTVALLLQGPVGAFEAFRDYTSELLLAMFGGHELFWGVLCQATPLALAVGAVTFAYRCRWFSFTSPTALLFTSLLVLGATWLGRELRSALVQHHSQVASQSDVESQAELALQANVKSFATPNHPLASLASIVSPPSPSSDTMSIRDAMKMFSDVQSSAAAGGEHGWDESVPRVRLIPESDTLIGIVGKACNQMIGFFVVYQPRLFVAAVLLGSYVGWTWQPYYQFYIGDTWRRLGKQARETGAKCHRDAAPDARVTCTRSFLVVRRLRGS